MRFARSVQWVGHDTGEQREDLIAAWAWTLIAIGIVVAVALIVLAMPARRKTTRLRHAFGSEHDRTVQATSSRASWLRAAIPSKASPCG
jgi:heme/copper-type cytochrome/quinol oxidase subunit 2